MDVKKGGTIGLLLASVFGAVSLTTGRDNLADVMPEKDAASLQERHIQGAALVRHGIETGEITGTSLQDVRIKDKIALMDPNDAGREVLKVVDGLKRMQQGGSLGESGQDLLKKLNGDIRHLDTLIVNKYGESELRLEREPHKSRSSLAYDPRLPN